ncbi:hypothetical protein ACXWTF_12635 [Thiomicrolovo sp. ZZH C-3]
MDTAEIIQRENSSGFLSDLGAYGVAEALYFGALLYGFTTDDIHKIGPLGDFPKKYLCSVSQNTGKVLKKLYDNGLIWLHEASDPKSLIVRDDEISEYYYMRCMWLPNIVDNIHAYGSIEKLPSNIMGADPERYVPLYRKLSSGDFESALDQVLTTMAADDKNADDFGDELYELWVSVNYDDALGYLYLKMDEYNLPTEHVGEAIMQAIREYTGIYSNSEMYMLIYQAVKSAAAYRQKERVSAPHAVNSINGGLKSIHGRLSSGDWDKRSYGRDFNLPRSMLSEYLFDHVLHIGEKGFTMVPDRNFVREIARGMWGRVQSRETVPLAYDRLEPVLMDGEFWGLRKRILSGAARSPETQPGVAKKDFVHFTAWSPEECRVAIDDIAFYPGSITLKYRVLDKDDKRLLEKWERTFLTNTPPA